MMMLPSHFEGTLVVSVENPLLRCPSSDKAGVLVWHQERILVPNGNDRPTCTHLQETSLRLLTYFCSTSKRST